MILKPLALNLKDFFMLNKKSSEDFLSFVLEQSKSQLRRVLGIFVDKEVTDIHMVVKKLKKCEQTLELLIIRT